MSNSAHITLPTSMKTEIQGLAQDADRTFSSMCRVLLAEALENRKQVATYAETIERGLGPDYR